MKLKHFLSAITASSLGMSYFSIPHATFAQTIVACPDPSTLTSVANPGDPTSFESVTGGDCSGTPSEYGVTIYKMGFCVSDPSPTSGAANYSSCSTTFEDSSGSRADFSAGTSFGALSANLTTRPEDGTYGYAFILIGNTFNIRAQYGPIAGNTYYSTSTSTGWPAAGNTVGPATTNPVQANSFGQKCDSQDSLGISSGRLTGTLLNASQARIPDSAAVATCAGATYILGVVALNSSITVDESVTGLNALFTVTNNGTTLSIDNQPGGVAGLIFDSGPFNVVLEVIRNGGT